MPIYELVNPSDAYTFDTDDVQALCVGVAMYSNGWYGITDDQDKCVIGVTALGGIEEWAKEQFGSMEKLKEVLATKEFRLRIATALETIMIGKTGTRKALMMCLKEVPEEKRKELQVKMIEEQRTSMNDIGGGMLRYAAGIRDKIKKEGQLCSPSQ